MARPNFIELPAADLAAAKRFYSTVFGWTLTDFGPTYSCTLTGDVDIGLQADMAEATKAPLPVIEVSDLEASLAQAQAAGATIVKPIFGFPGGRRFHFRDPNGNELAVMQADPD
ncbi:VOC family protein [Phenylobacterium sp.]|uniref:VOC family protein n=1 Tax=Phenylobacterium sp. TaxID=1871053 RepID=UPI002DEC617E|nr:VOC family protein [Phenylobacterium sp.]